MSLIQCPSCRKRISSLTTVCPHCHFIYNNKDPNATEEALKQNLRRRYRNQQYRLKMLSFLAMSITMIGAVPMLWSYINAIESGNEASPLKHWGIYPVILGFFMYLIIRIIMMINRKRFINRK